MYVKDLLNTHIGFLQRENQRKLDYINNLKNEIKLAEKEIEINLANIQELEFTLKVVGD